MSLAAYDTFQPVTSLTKSELKDSSPVLDAAISVERQFLRDVIISASYVDTLGNLDILENDTYGLNTMVDVIRVLDQGKAVVRSQKAHELANVISENSLDISPLLKRILLNKTQTGLMEGVVITSFTDLAMTLKTGTSPLGLNEKHQFSEIAQRASVYRDALRDSFQGKIFLPTVVFGYSGKLTPVQSTLPN